MNVLLEQVFLEEKSCFLIQMRKCIWPLTQTIWLHVSMFEIHSIITCFSSEIQPEVLPTLESNFLLETVVH